MELVYHWPDDPQYARLWTNAMKNTRRVIRIQLDLAHPRRHRGGQSGREKRRDKCFQVQAEKPLGTDSHRTISKRSSDCWLLIAHKKCFVLLCPIGEQHLLSSFREFVHDGYYLATVARFVHHEAFLKPETKELPMSRKTFRMLSAGAI